MKRKRKKKSPKRKFHATALLRNAMILAAVVAVFVIVRGPSRPTPSKAYALPALSRGLMAVPPIPPYLFESEGVEKPRRAIIAGQELFFRVQTAEGSPRDVVRFYRNRYEHSTTEFLRKVMTAGGQSSQRRMAEAMKRLDDLYRAATDDSGMLVALELREPDADAARLEAQIEAFARTGNLGELWTARVINIYAQGDSGRSTVVSFWTGTDFNVNALLKGFEPPVSGDEEGREHQLLTIAFPDEPRPLTFTLSRFDRPGPAVLSKVQQRLLSQGWESTLPQKGAGRAPDTLRMLKRGDEELSIVVADDPAASAGTFVGTMHWQSSET